MNRIQNTVKKHTPAGDMPTGMSITNKIEAYLGRAQAFLQEFFLRAGKPVDTMYRVAQERYYEGEFSDAASRLRLVVKFQPANAHAWYLLGSCDLEMNNTALAAMSLRKALALNPQHEEARFLLAVLDPSLPQDQQPRFAPLTLATEHFDGQALYYDQENLYDLGYTGHEEAFRAVRPFLNPNYRQFKIIDLGCGTGLAALQFRDIAGLIEGVDISQNMLDQAEVRRDDKERRVYDALHLIDLRRYLLDQPPASCDIIVAANVFPYVGGLTPVFDGMAHALKPGGVASFSVEPIPGNDFALIPGEGRFGHSEAYIAEQAKRVGLDVLEVRPFEMFVGAEATQFVLRKPVPGQQPAAQPPASPQGTPPQGMPPQGTPPQTGGGFPPV